MPFLLLEIFFPASYGRLYLPFRSHHKCYLLRGPFPLLDGGGSHTHVCTCTDTHTHTILRPPRQGMATPMSPSHSTNAQEESDKYCTHPSYGCWLSTGCEPGTVTSLYTPSVTKAGKTLCSREASTFFRPTGQLSRGLEAGDSAARSGASTSSRGKTRGGEPARPSAVSPAAPSASPRAAKGALTPSRHDLAGRCVTWHGSHSSSETTGGEPRTPVDNTLQKSSAI